MYFWVSSKLYYKHALPQKGQHEKIQQRLADFMESWMHLFLSSPHYSIHFSPYVDGSLT